MKITHQLLTLMTGLQQTDPLHQELYQLMKNKLKPGDTITLKGNPLDEQQGQSLNPIIHRQVLQTSKTIPCGSGLAIKIEGHDGWIDSAWAILVKRKTPRKNKN